MAVAPAGDIVEDSGHNHLLINRMSVASGASVPFDDNHRNFGASQTEAMITLPSGLYKFTSQFANGAHQSYGAPLSASIQITVKSAALHPAKPARRIVWLAFLMSTQND